MKNRIFLFCGVCIFAACVLTGVIASVLTGWMLQGKTQPAGRLAGEMPVAFAAGCDRAETYTTCTGMMEMGVEAVYVLDSMTGQLFGGVIAKNNVGFQSVYQGNVKNDLNVAITKYNTAVQKMAGRTSRSKGSATMSAAQQIITVPQEPKFIMTTGMHDRVGRVGNIMPSTSALFITEVNTGLMLVYVLPWSKTHHSTNNPYKENINCIFYERVIIPKTTEIEI